LSVLFSKPLYLPDGAGPEFIRAASFVDGYLSALQLQKASSGIPELRVHLNPLKEKLSVLVNLCSAMPQLHRLYLERAQDGQSDEQVQDCLRETTVAIGALKKVIDRYADLMDLARQAGDGVLALVQSAWPPSAQETMCAALDSLEDFQETLALGLSPEFRDAVLKAQEEAGIDNTRPSKQVLPSD
jgi:hypothetical protein